MTELTFRPLLTMTGLVESAKHSLRIDTERHLLHLDRLEDLCFLLLSFLSFSFFLFTKRLLFLLVEFFARFSGLCCLLLNLLDLFLDFGRFIFLRMCPRKRYPSTCR